MTSSGATGSFGGEFYVADAVNATNATISKLESSYSGSKMQIETLRAMGFEEGVLIMKAEVDKQRDEFQQTLRNKAWTNVEEFAKRSEQKSTREVLASNVATTTDTL